MEKATKEELMATVKKQRQVALRYKGRFTEVGKEEYMPKEVHERECVYSVHEREREREREREMKYDAILVTIVANVSLKPARALLLVQGVFSREHVVSKCRQGKDHVLFT